MSITEDAELALAAISEVVKVLEPFAKEARQLILKQTMEWVEHSERKRLQEESA